MERSEEGGVEGSLRSLESALGENILGAKAPKATKTGRSRGKATARSTGPKVSKDKAMAALAAMLAQGQQRQLPAGSGKKPYRAGPTAAFRAEQAAEAERIQQRSGAFQKMTKKEQAEALRLINQEQAVRDRTTRVAGASRGTTAAGNSPIPVRGREPKLLTGRVASSAADVADAAVDAPGKKGGGWGLLNGAGVVGGALAIASAINPNIFRDVDNFFSGGNQRAARRRLEGPTGVAMQLRQQRLQRAMMENEAMLATMDPHLYAELNAGEKLAPGARVFGGSPNRDVVEQAILEMMR
jgi:hypothetical protein